MCVNFFVLHISSAVLQYIILEHILFIYTSSIQRLLKIKLSISPYCLCDRQKYNISGCFYKCQVQYTIACTYDDFCTQGRGKYIAPRILHLKHKFKTHVSKEQSNTKYSKGYRLKTKYVCDRVGLMHIST